MRIQLSTYVTSETRSRISQDGSGVVVVAAAAEHPAVEPEAGEERGNHREEARDRHHSHVPVRDVRQLVSEDALDLARPEPIPEAAVTATTDFSGSDRSRRRSNVGGDDSDPRHRQVAHGREPLDHRVELGRLLARHDLCADAASAILSDVKNWRKASPPMITMIAKYDRLKSWSRTTKKTT